MPGHEVRSYRLSSAQERIWFLEQLTPGTPAFTVSSALRVDGRLDLASLRHAVAELVARHEALRTRFVLRQGEPAQEVLPQADVPVEVTDVRSQPDPQATATAAAREQLNSAFDLASAPLIRVQVIQSGPRNALLVISLHHIICDGASAALLLRDLRELYLAHLRSGEPGLPELPVQCGDFAEWQRDVADERVLAQQLEFWRGELAGTNGRSGLATKRERPSAPDLHGALLCRTLPADTARALLRVAQDEQASPFMLVLAAFELAVARTSGRADFCVGVASASRTRPEIADVVGCFLNLLPIRSDIGAGLTVRELLRRVRARCLRAYAHADLPFERIARDLVPGRDATGPALFDVLIEVQNARAVPFQAGDATLTPLLAAADVARYDMALDAELDSGGVNLRLSYATALFSEPDARLLLDRVIAALSALAGDMSTLLSDVPMPAAGPSATAALHGEDRPEFAAAHCGELAREFLARTAAERIVTRRVGDLWPARRVRGTAVAVARQLANRGLQPGDLVGVQFPDGPARLAASIGVWLAGGCALLPAAPGSGPEAAAYGNVMVISQAREAEGAAADDPALPPASRPEQPALAGCSGLEAGRPRGVGPLLTGGAVASIARSLARCWELTGGTFLLEDSASPVEALAALTAGCAVTYVSAADSADAATLASLLSEPGSTAACLPQASWAALAAAGWTAPPGFRAICTAPPRRLVTARLLAAGARVLVSLRLAGGGAWYAAGEIAQADTDPVLAVLPNIRATVIDGTGAAAVPGSAGELLLAGAAAPSPTQTGEFVRLSAGGLTVPAATAGEPDRDDPASSAAPPRDATERLLLDSFHDILGRSDIGVHDEFFAVGGTSLAAVRLTGAISAALGRDLPLKLLFTSPTVAALAEALREEAAGTDGAAALMEAEDDAVLPAAITPAGPPRVGRATTVLLTGATGFLGSHLLAELLAVGTEQVICLIRGADLAQGTGRLREALAGYSLDADFSRVAVVTGDLGAPALGLSDAAFAALADQADAIYHVGAHVSFGLPYRSLRAPNVLGTRELLRLACTGRPSAVHFISTFDAATGPRLAEEPVPLSTGSADGYELSKKAAEQLVLAAAARGLPVGVYRPWLISGSTSTGAVNAADQLTLFLRGILLSGIAPAELPAQLRVTPVDRVARIIVELSQCDRAAAEPPIYHLFNPQPTPVSVVKDSLIGLGYDLRSVPHQEWRVQLTRRTANQLDGLAALLAIDPAADRDPDQVSTVNTSRRLGREPSWPAYDQEYVRKIVTFLTAARMVPTPRSGELAGAR
jgi:thioester reductase-like protein